MRDSLGWISVLVFWCFGAGFRGCILRFVTFAVADVGLLDHIRCDEDRVAVHCLEHGRDLLLGLVGGLVGKVAVGVGVGLGFSLVSSEAW